MHPRRGAGGPPMITRVFIVCANGTMATPSARQVGTSVGSIEQGRSTAPGAASADRAGVRFSFAGRSGPAVQAVRTPQRIAAWPLDAYSPAVACGGRGVSRTTPVPPTIRRAGHRALPHRGTTSDRSSVTHETSRHGLSPSARPTESSGPRGSTARRSAMAVQDTPPSARDRDVALGALAVASTALPRDCGEARPAPSGAATDAGHPSGDAPEGQVTAADSTTPSLPLHQPRA